MIGAAALGDIGGFPGHSPEFMGNPLVLLERTWRCG